MNVKNILVHYKTILKQNRFETYSLDVEVLLMRCTGFSKTEIYLNVDYELTDKQFMEFQKFFNKRLKKEPIAYIIGMCEFMGIDFFLNEHTLIPRPDTEILVEKAIEIINCNNVKSVLDIGTGSGAIAISIAKYCKECEVIGVDINDKAIEKAKYNATHNNITNVSFLESDIFSALTSENTEFKKFDMIISNPPYIRTSEIDELDENVKNYEPLLALDGGEDGLIFYREIVKNSKNYLKKGGHILFEIGYDQANCLFSILEQYEFKNINVLKDLAGLDRVVFANL